jgi:hypothetical protein
MGAEPPAPDADWAEIDRYARSFNAYDYWGSLEKCAEVGNAARKAYDAEGELPRSLDVLRTCLFFEQRRFKHFNREPDEEEMKYIRALVEATRGRLERGTTIWRPKPT